MDQKTFSRAVQNWQAGLVRDALGKRPEWATRVAENGMTVLHQCARTNLRKSGLKDTDSVATAQALIDAGAEVNHVRIIMDDGEAFLATPLWYAVAWGENPRLVKFLLDRGAEPNDCLWAASWAGSRELTRLLLDFGAKVDAVAHGETPLQFILKYNRPSVAHLLIEHGADINYQDAEGMTALHFAVKKKFTLKQIQSILDLGADRGVTNNDGDTPAALAHRLNRPKVAKLLASNS